MGYHREGPRRIPTVKSRDIRSITREHEHYATLHHREMQALYEAVTRKKSSEKFIDNRLMDLGIYDEMEETGEVDV
jgi:hypothetical protein